MLTGVQLQTREQARAPFAPWEHLLAVLARPVALRVLKAQGEYEMRVEPYGVKPVRKAAIRIRQARPNAFHAVLAPLKEALVTQLVICVHSENILKDMETNVSRALPVILQPLEGTPAA